MTVEDLDKLKGKKLSERQLMELAVEVSRRCLSEPGKVSPQVGAVIARNGVLLDFAYRGEMKAGEHAEFTLLERKLPKARLSSAVLYTTLEPCTHRNHPKVACCERVIDRGLKRVVIGTLDPNPIVRGTGELRMQEAGIEITRFDPDLVPTIRTLNKPFVALHPLRPIQRTAMEAGDPVRTGDVGPNGFAIGYTKEGDKVEWVPSEEVEGEVWPMLLRRNGYPQGIQRAMGQGLVEPSPELALPPCLRRRDIAARSGVDPSDGQEGRTAHRAQVWEAEPGMG